MSPYVSLMDGLSLAEPASPLGTGTADNLIAELIRRKKEEERRRQLMQPQSPLQQSLMAPPQPQPAAPTTGVFGGGPDRFAGQEDLIAQMRENVANARRMNAEPQAPVDPSSPAWDFLQRQARGLSQPQQSPLGATLTQGPAAAPDPNKLENVIAGFVGRNPEGKDYGSFSVKGDGQGGLDFDHKRIRGEDVAARNVNSVSGDATRQQARTARLDERQQNRTQLIDQRRQEGQQSALLAALMADPRSAAAFMGLQGDIYGANSERTAEQAAQHAQLQAAPWLIGVQNGTMTPEAAQQGIAGILGGNSGQPQASVPAKPALTEPDLTVDQIAQQIETLSQPPLFGESPIERQVRELKLAELQKRFAAMTGSSPTPPPARPKPPEGPTDYFRSDLAF